MGGNKGKRYRVGKEKGLPSTTTIADRIAAIDAEDEREFREVTRKSLTQVAPGDEVKPADKQRRVPRDTGSEPIKSCEDFTNALLTALGWLAGDPELGIVDLLVGAAVKSTVDKHRLRYELAVKLALFDRAIRRLLQVVHDDQPLVQSLLDMSADHERSLPRQREWEERGNSYHDFAYGMISRIHANFSGFRWGRWQPYDTLFAFVDDHWEVLTELTERALRIPRKRDANTFDAVSRSVVRSYVNEVAGEGRRMRVRHGEVYTGEVERLQRQSVGCDNGSTQPGSLDEGLHETAAPALTSQVMSTDSTSSAHSLSQRNSDTNDHQPFTGGDMVFHADRVELCGVDICSGSRAASKRTALELLSQKRNGDTFVAYSGEQLENRVKELGGRGEGAGLIRGLRDDITERLRTQANIDCGRREVILSGGPGYRFSGSINVQYADAPVITDITDIEEPEDVRNVPIDNVPNESDFPEDSSVRINWILERLADKGRLKAPDVAGHFGCSVKTARRDLASLKDEGKIEYVGTPRTGYYRPCPSPRSNS